MEYDDHMAYKRLEALNAHTNVLQATLATLRQDTEDSEATDLANMPLDALTADDASLPSHLRASALWTSADTVPPSGNARNGRKTAANKLPDHTAPSTASTISATCTTFVRASTMAIL